jgi:hypothetical protein
VGTTLSVRSVWVMSTVHPHVRGDDSPEEIDAAQSAFALLVSKLKTL